MPSKQRRIPADPSVSGFPNEGFLVNLAARLADLAFFGDVTAYETEAAEANRHLSKAEVGFVLGYIACANAPPDDTPPVLVAAVRP